MSNDIGRTGKVEGGSEVGISDSRFNEDPIFAIFRFLDLDFVFSLLLSLFAILMGYDAISGEKERGTLRLTFANAVPKHTFVLGKLMGGMLTLSFSVIFASAIGSLIYLALGVPMSSFDWMKLGLILLVGLMYLGAFLSLSLFVSSFTHRSANSFLLLLVVWIGAVMIVPRASVLLAGRAVEVPTVDSIANLQSALSGQLRDEFINSLSSYKMPQGGNMEENMAGFQGFMDSISNTRMTKMDELTERLYEDRTNRQEVQEAMAFNLARLSPATSLTLATTTLAGTSLELKNQFKQQAGEYQDVWADFLEEKTGISPRSMMRMRHVVDDGSPKEEPEYIDPTELPRFEFRAEEPAEAAASTVVDMGLLLFYNLLFFAGTFVAFIRYDVR